MMIPALLDVIGAVPDLPAIPTFQQMVRNTQATWLRYPDLVTVTRVGVSGQGEPIDMISIGNGPMSALFVGAPHPNEPVGCLVIEHLIDRLCSDHALRRALPYRWHFIKAIEPDALRLNEGWFSAPGDLLRYYENYYRPPIEEQAEYAFPFDEDDRLARHPMPENEAWRKAIELAKPDFLYSLHNSEFGGAYYLLSDMPIGLSDELRALCDTYACR
ncbi:M14 family zinc carboxypeptidase [Burkholderia sp. MR1-5-21]